MENKLLNLAKSTIEHKDTLYIDAPSMKEFVYENNNERHPRVDYFQSYANYRNVVLEKVTMVQLNEEIKSEKLNSVDVINGKPAKHSYREFKNDNLEKVYKELYKKRKDFKVHSIHIQFKEGAPDLTIKPIINRKYLEPILHEDSMQEDKTSDLKWFKRVILGKKDIRTIEESFNQTPVEYEVVYKIKYGALETFISKEDMEGLVSTIIAGIEEVREKDLETRIKAYEK